ncbi:MAG: DinB family protein [Planctomycetota bacterium]
MSASPVTPDAVVNQLERNATVFRALLIDRPEQEYRWRPDPQKWNLLDVVCHLYDEERDDFRARVRSVLEDPTRPFVPANPEAWVVDRKYAEQDYEAMLGAFLRERVDSVRWLRSLADPQWANAYLHPRVGPVTAKRLLVNWLAHDLLHVRQITRLQYEALRATSNENLDYAGTW